MSAIYCDCADGTCQRCTTASLHAILHDVGAPTHDKAEGRLLTVCERIRALAADHDDLTDWKEKAKIVLRGLWLRRNYDRDHPIAIDLTQRAKDLSE